MTHTQNPSHLAFRSIPFAVPATLSPRSPLTPFILSNLSVIAISQNVVISEMAFPDYPIGNLHSFPLKYKEGKGKKRGEGCGGRVGGQIHRFNFPSLHRDRFVAAVLLVPVRVFNQSPLHLPTA